MSPLNSPAWTRIFLVAVTTAGLLALVLSPEVKRRIGIIDFGIWFLDSYAVLAASDAVRIGLNPDEPNPLDVLSRPHAYSDWWFGLGLLGLSREDNFLVGGSWVLAFLLVAWTTLRPRDWGEAALLALMLLSPPVLLAVNRANNDLVVFVLLGAALIALRGTRHWNWVLALMAIALATGLKFYPVVAAYVFVLLRPGRRVAIACGAATLVLGVVLFNVFPALARAGFTLPQSLYTFGAPIIFRDLGWTGGGAKIAGAAIVLAGGSLLARMGRTIGLADASRDCDRRMLFTMGAAVLLACFLAGASFAYRGIFTLWLVPWLWDEAHDHARPMARRVAAWFAGALAVALVWLDGLYFLVANTVLPALPHAQFERQLTWRLATQPLAWLLMIMLAGWLLDAAVAAVRQLYREWRERHCSVTLA